MNKYLLIGFLLLIFRCYAQESNKVMDLLQYVRTQDQVDSLQLNNPQISIRKLTRTTSDPDFDTILFHIEVGEIRNATSEKYIKLLSKETIKEFKVKYIWLDGNKMESDNIDPLKKQILDAYQSGESFGSLADKYSMDPRKNQGELGWFPEGRMVKPFENAIKNHKKNEVFDAYEEERNWHFIILKTHDERESGEFEFIEIKNLKIIHLETESTNERIVRPTISLAINKENKLTRVEIIKIECSNCNENELNTEITGSIIAKCFDHLKDRALKGDFNQGRVYVVPFNISIE